METKTRIVEEGRVREFLQHYGAHYEVSPYFILLDERKFGAPESRRRIQAGFDVDLYGKGVDLDSLLASPNGDLRATLDLLDAVCDQIASHATGHCTIEIIPFESTLVLDVKKQFQPEVLLRIRVTHTRGLDQPAGASEEKALADLTDKLDSLGAKRS